MNILEIDIVMRIDMWLYFSLMILLVICVKIGNK